MIWLSRTFDGDKWFHVQSLFETHFKAMGSPKDMMLVFVEKSGFKTEIIVGLPDKSNADPYEGFSPIDSVPERAGLLVGHHDEYQRRFEPAEA